MVQGIMINVGHVGNLVLVETGRIPLVPVRVRLLVLADDFLDDCLRYPLVHVVFIQFLPFWLRYQIVSIELDQGLLGIGEEVVEENLGKVHVLKHVVDIEILLDDVL